MNNIHELVFPNEPENYRKARNELLIAEIDLRKQIESVAQLKKNLPLGGELKEDYIFIEGSNDLKENGLNKQVRFSELFHANKNSLIIYNFMFPPSAESPCPACTSLIDGLNGLAMHVQSRVNFVIVARAPIEKTRAWAQKRNWHNLRLLSSLNNTYNMDYFGETQNGDQMPNLNVFTKSNGIIYHYYSTELLYTPTEEGQHPRHADLYWPIWSLFEITPEGRGTDWFPKYSYD